MVFASCLPFRLPFLFCSPFRIPFLRVLYPGRFRFHSSKVNRGCLDRHWQGGSKSGTVSLSTVGRPDRVGWVGCGRWFGEKEKFKGPRCDKEKKKSNTNSASGAAGAIGERSEPKKSSTSTMTLSLDDANGDNESRGLCKIVLTKPRTDRGHGRTDYPCEKGREKSCSGQRRGGGGGVSGVGGR